MKLSKNILSFQGKYSFQHVFIFLSKPIVNHIAANDFNIIYSSNFRSLLEAGGVDRLMTITRQRQRFTPRVVKFASQVLYSMWVHQDLRETYRKAGWKEADFVTKTVRRMYHTLYLQILLLLN